MRFFCSQEDKDKGPKDEAKKSATEKLQDEVRKSVLTGPLVSCTGSVTAPTLEIEALSR